MPEAEYASNQLIVKLSEDTPKEEIVALQDEIQAVEVESTQTLDLYLWKTDQNVEKAIAALKDKDWVEYAEPNYVISINGTPNDPDFSELWGMNNTGQTDGKVDADIDAPEAWDKETGSEEVVVGIIDTGVDVTHEDLADNIWTNPGEIPDNDIDDDNNGYVDDVHGYDFAYDDSNPNDEYGHGTHVSGTIGAVGNNGVGIAGVNWDVKIMALKFLDDWGSGYTFDAIQAIEYGILMGADITNNSWGGGGYEQSLYDAIAAAGEAGQLFVAAAGNDYGNDNDIYPHYPSSYDLDNIISVAATDHDDELAYFSNYGPETVDLAAPGDEIYSTVPWGYEAWSGTSMATPHVAGAAALIWAHNPNLTADQVKQYLLTTVDPIESMQGLVVSNGRLNLNAALTGPQPGSISGKKWNDLDADGKKDNNESFLSGWTIFLDQDGDGQKDSGEKSTLTNANGQYTFNNLAPGSYTVAEVQDPGWQQTYPFIKPGYVWSDSDSPNGPEFNWKEISDVGEQVYLWEDDYTWIELPFDFPFYGTDRSSVYISSNGFLTFDYEGGWQYNNQPIPTASNPNQLIAPFWDDLYADPDYQGKIYYYYDEAENQFIVQYDDVPNYDGGSMTFEVILKPDGEILFQYKELVGTVDSATVGVENNNGTKGLEIAYNETYLKDELAISISPSDETVPISHKVFVGNGEDVIDINFGNYDLPPSDISGTVWKDLNANGKWDTGEQGYSNRKVYLDANQNGKLDTGEREATTNASGAYSFDNLDPGTYTVAQVVPLTLKQSYPREVVIGNKGFEKGNLNNWQTAGSVAAKTSSSGYEPTEGKYQALLQNIGQSASDTELETFLELEAGSLDAIGNGDVVEGSALKRTITVAAGDTLSFDWNFLTDESSQDYKDFAFVMLGELNTLADINDVSSLFREQTGYSTYQHTFTKPGEYTVALGVVDVNDNSVKSGLLVDNFKLISGDNPQSHSVKIGAGESFTDVNFATYQLNPPVISISNPAPIVEGIADNNKLNFTVSLSQASNNPVTVEYKTVAETAKAGSDFTVASGTLTFAAGQTSKTIQVPIINNNADEPDETFRVELKNASGGNLANQEYGIGTITDTIKATKTTTLAAQVENLLLLGNSAINGTGNAKGNTITGNNAKNQLMGEGGSDRLFGKGGEDILNGGASGDLMSGGAGNDLYFVNSPADQIVEVEGEGTDKIKSSVNYTLPVNVENIILQGANNLDAVGNSLKNQLIGNAGDNVLSGRGGNDVLNGKNGADLLVGGSDNDLLIGGLGNDKFFFNLPSEALDKIQDFIPGEDKIIISSLGFNLSEDAVSKDYFTYNSNQGKIYFHSSGIGEDNDSVAIAKFINLPDNFQVATDIQLF